MALGKRKQVEQPLFVATADLPPPKSNRYYEAVNLRKQPWQRVELARQTLGPQLWHVKAGQVHLQRDGQPTDRTYWLIVARNVATGEVKYFVSNAPPQTPLLTLLTVAFSRWGVEHAFRLAKTEVGFGHFEGRTWLGLLRHMILCQVCCSSPSRPIGSGGENLPEVTMEQVARALNVVCQRWLDRRLGTSAVPHVAEVIRYRQRRNAAAKRSR
jgi:hypothetical protein